MSAAPLTLMATVGAPVTCSGADSGADVNAALWPGMSNVRAPAADPADDPDPAAPRPRPGNPDIEGGVPPGGLMIVAGGPASRTVACLVPFRPGQLAAVATPRFSGPVHRPKPSRRLTA